MKHVETALLLTGAIAAAMLIGAMDRDSAVVSHKTAMEAPRPIFEPVHDLQHLGLPCDYIKVSAALKEEFRCVNADGRK